MDGGRSNINKFWELKELKELKTIGYGEMSNKEMSNEEMSNKEMSNKE